MQLKRIFAWRNNTGGFENARGHFFRFGKVGSGDILAVLPGGIFVSIEVKQPGKKPTDVQKEFMRMINRNYGIAFVATCLEDVMARGF